VGRRVLDQVAEHLPQPLGNRGHRWNRAVRLHHDTESRVEPRHSPPRGVHRVDGLEVHPQLASVGQGEVAEVVHQVLQQQRLLLEGAEQVAALRALADRWAGSTLKETQAFQTWFHEFCDALGAARPGPAGAGS
jgi:hypothetical protein